MGEWLLFFDADVVLPRPEFLDVAMKEFLDGNYDVATCLMNPLSNRQMDRVLYGAANLYLWATKGFFPHAPGFCIFCTKAAHRTVGGFDERMRLAEDHDYVSRISKFGHFGLLRRVRISVSVRRLDKDGRLNVSVKYVAAEAHQIILGPIYSDIFNYRFGHYD
jgi:hypothetical protein